MLDVGLSELLLTAVVALVVVGPKDLPVVLRHVAKFVREVRGIFSGLKQQMNALVDESGATRLHEQVNTIIDLEGKPQQAYSVEDLASLEAPKRGEP